MNEIEIREYISPEGGNPFREWLLHLRDAKIRARIRERLDRIRLGNYGDCKSLGGGVFELRFVFGSGYRVYFGNVGSRIVILLGGGDKSSQVSDIAKAHLRWNNYRRHIDEAE